MTDDDTFKVLRQMPWDDLMEIYRRDHVTWDPADRKSDLGLEYYHPKCFVGWLTTHGWKLSEYVSEQEKMNIHMTDWDDFKKLCSDSGVYHD